MTRHQYGISALVSQTSFRGETTGGVAKCRLFSQANLFEVGKEGGTQTHYKSFRRAVGPLLLTVALILNPPRGFFLPFSKGKALQTRCVVLTLLKQPERRLRSFTVT